MQFPLQITFKISTITNDFRVHDAEGREQAFVRQKLFKLKEEVSVFSDESRSKLSFRIKADRWLDFSATYRFLDAQDNEIGRIVASYQIYDEKLQADFSISEDNPFVKIMDGIFGDLPLIGLFSGYFFNPSYIITRPDGIAIARLKKEKSFFGRRFSVQKLSEFESGEENRLVLGLMMMILLERSRG